MRIAFFIDDYLPSVHGVATSTLNYKQALESRQNAKATKTTTITSFACHQPRIMFLISVKWRLFTLA